MLCSSLLPFCFLYTYKFLVPPSQTSASEMSRKQPIIKSKLQLSVYHLAVAKPKLYE